ncbi:glutathione S-transferase N-terminal domain-containing protein [Allosphingosinicella flava]|uniref:glutathione S-transferase N-terminal domain-containing protein n=1 Tax=Allosphingosinicella flava TaxID=2771430 RepID=UPI001CF7AE7D|nr:glutathione S-transferase N-terminal domain-containing protein [Sphingosinicella flava]
MSTPPIAARLARDLRVRWALEEVGQPYEVRLVSFEEMKAPAYLALHPFGQIPAYHEGNLTGILDDYPALTSYIARGEARPAYQKAFADQLAVFTGRS